jgi:hypothetical protein
MVADWNYSRWMSLYPQEPLPEEGPYPFDDKNHIGKDAGRRWAIAFCASVLKLCEIFITKEVDGIHDDTKYRRMLTATQPADWENAVKEYIKENVFDDAWGETMENMWQGGVALWAMDFCADEPLSYDDCK